MEGSTNASTWRSNAMQQLRVPATASVQSPASVSSTEEEWTTVDDPRYDTIIIGYEQGTDHPLTMDRETAAQMYPRHAEFLKGDENPYRLPGIPSRPQSTREESSSDTDWVEVERAVARVVQRSDGYGSLYEPILLPRVASGVESGVQANDSKVVETVKGKNAATWSRRTRGPYGDVVASAAPRKSSLRLQYMDGETFARLEGKDCFPQEPEGALDWNRIGLDDAVLGAARRSKCSDDSGAAPRKPGGVFRSLSKKVKGALRRPSASKRGEVSEPVEVQDLHPAWDGPEVLHPGLKAIPLEEAQKRFLKGTGMPQHPSPPDTDRYPHALRSRPSKSKRPVRQQRAVAPPPRLPERTRQIKVVGSPDRMTEFGDFIDLSDSDTTAGGHQVHTNDDEDSDFELLEIKPLRPGSKALPSRNTIIRNPLPPPAKVTSLYDWRMSEDYPTVRDLFNRIDEQIADADIPENEKPAARQEAHRLNRRFDRPAPDAEGVDADEYAEPETVVDTFIHEGYASWYVTSRPDASTVTSEDKRIDSPQQETSGDADEVAQRRELVRGLRAGLDK